LPIPYVVPAPAAMQMQNKIQTFAGGYGIRPYGMCKEKGSPALAGELSNVVRLRGCYTSSFIVAFFTGFFAGASAFVTIFFAAGVRSSSSTSRLIISSIMIR